VAGSKYRRAAINGDRRDAKLLTAKVATQVMVWCCHSAGVTLLV